jgi:hypothetical protein
MITIVIFKINLRIKGSLVKRIASSLLALTALTIGADNLKEIFSKAKMSGEVRFGVVQIEDDLDKKTSTVALGGSLGVKTSPLAGISLGATFYTTNSLLGKDRESMFLDSNNDSYSILGESYLQASFGKTTLKAGQQIIDTPYIDSDDIGMILNTFQGITLINQDITDTTVILASIDKWSGVDSDTPEKFNEMQSSGDEVIIASLIYEGIENTTVQAWHYRLDDVDFNYFEAGYEEELFNLGFQYTDQDNDNTAFGLLAGVNIGELSLTTAYNRVDGVVSNGFGGGPFFTSAEDHTIEINELNQEGILVGAEYSLERLTLAVIHANFDKGENDTDYTISYVVNDKHSLDLIYSDMYDDGKMVRFFANYSF